MLRPRGELALRLLLWLFLPDEQLLDSLGNMALESDVAMEAASSGNLWTLPALLQLFWSLPLSWQEALTREPRKHDNIIEAHGSQSVSFYRFLCFFIGR